MDWLRRGEEKRGDPQMVLSGARSVIVLAMNYWQGERETEPRPWTGRIARYAWGDDYHEVIEPKLKKLDELLRELGGTQKCYVDTGPVLERDFAAEAGVGWHGKSTMLLNRELGTWFFLAEILTTLELPEDAPQRDALWKLHALHYGLPDGRDHRAASARCPSLHFLSDDRTQERHSPRIAAAHRRSHLWLRRLSRCLPWNRFATIVAGDRIRGTPGFAKNDFDRFSRARRFGFSRALSRFAHQADQTPRFPAQRLRGARERRDHEDLAALENAARDPDSLISEHASWAIAQIHGAACLIHRTMGAALTVVPRRGRPAATTDSEPRAESRCILQFGLLVVGAAHADADELFSPPNVEDRGWARRSRRLPRP